MTLLDPGPIITIAMITMVTVTAVTPTTSTTSTTLLLPVTTTVLPTLIPTTAVIIITTTVCFRLSFDDPESPPRSSKILDEELRTTFLSIPSLGYSMVPGEHLLIRDTHEGFKGWKRTRGGQKHN